MQDVTQAISDWNSEASRQLLKDLKAATYDADPTTREEEENRDQTLAALLQNRETSPA